MTTTHSLDENTLLMGAGPMAVVYTKVLQELGIRPTVVGRGKASAEKFTGQTGINVQTENTEEFIFENRKKWKHAIIAVSEEQLGLAAMAAIKAGIPNILIEKPGALDGKELIKVSELARKNSAKVFIGYNRRFYSSVLKAKEIIEQDGGVTSFTFDFTERGHLIEKANKPDSVKEEWIFHNSSHVIDMAFFLGGHPAKMSNYVMGSLSWHKRAARFVGAGLTKAGVPFSYHANWDSPNRWGVEVMTHQHRLIFRPLEKLQIQKLSSFEILPIELDDKLDAQFKPGIFLQTKEFIQGNCKSILSLNEQLEMVPIFDRITNGS